jgi:hypothetical protein
MSWTWRYETADGAGVEDPELPREGFPTQADAETWLGEVWRELLDRGVRQVTLTEDGRAVYGPMSLTAPD